MTSCREDWKLRNNFDNGKMASKIVSGRDNILSQVFTCKTSEEVTDIFKQHISGDKKKNIPREFAQHRIGLANKEGKCYFYLHYETKNEPLWYKFSNFWKAPIKIEGSVYPTTETYFQCEKVNPDNLRGKGLMEEDIEKCRSKWESMKLLNAGDAAKRGRQRDTKIDPEWDKGGSERAMHRALTAKFTQHKDLRDLLLSTGSVNIVEDTAQSGDYLWGIGADGTGRNLLGLALMKVRLELVDMNSPKT